MMRCSPEAFAQCPTSQYCGKSPAECEFAEGSDCDRYNQKIQCLQLACTAEKRLDIRKYMIDLVHYCTSCEECHDQDIVDHLIANDVLPVVRCGKCKRGAVFYKGVPVIYCTLRKACMSDHDYCSYGKESYDA